MQPGIPAGMRQAGHKPGYAKGDDMTNDRFTRAYIEAALWSSTDDDGNPLDDNYGPSDLAADTLARITRDCEAFQQAHEMMLLQAGDDEQNGHDFWLTRNHHGAGFWDRGYDAPVGERLTDAAHAAGEVNLYVGDDGQVHA